MTVSIEEAHRILTAPGSIFETEEREIRGVETRVWKNTPASLRSILELSRAHGERDFLVYEDDRLSFEEHYRKVAHLACILVEDYGVAKGERVAIAMRNFPEWSIAFWAAAAVGAIVVPLNAWWTPDELAFGLSDSGACVLFADEERVRRVDSLGRDFGIRAIIAARCGQAPPAPARRFEDVMGTPPAEVPLPEVEIDPEDDATIFYTSGTSGRPKGALGTHRNIGSNGRSRCPREMHRSARCCSRFRSSTRRDVTRYWREAPRSATSW
jgi:long-chain acyl-CoA synthetase